jgi:proprotein convertase subtilisin/kexin type 5
MIILLSLAFILSVAQPCPPPNCILDDCGDTGNCLSCDSGYFIPSCNACLTDCLACSDGTQCTTCRYLNVVTGATPNTCQQCDTNCKRCTTSASSCTDLCPTQTYYAKATDTCEPCISECLACSDGTRCTTCQYQNVVTGVVINTCQQCAINCKRCTASSCTSPCPIQTYYAKATDTCEPCISECLACSDAVHCTTCQYQSVVTGTTPNTCQQCDTNCKRCTASSCTDHCPTKTYYVRTADTCPSCHTTCKECTGSSNNMCIECLEVAYYLSMGRCLPCHARCRKCTDSSNSDCTDCYTSQNRILSSAGRCLCNPFYTMFSTALVCPPCNYPCYTCTNLLNCQSCNPADHRTLVGQRCPCDYQFWDDRVNHACPPCLPNCYLCNSGTICLECLVGYLLGGDSEYCELACLPGDYLNALGTKCVSCDLTCDDCNITYCHTCKPAYTWDLHGSCFVCRCPTCDDSCLNLCSPGLLLI